MCLYTIPDNADKSGGISCLQAKIPCFINCKILVYRNETKTRKMVQNVRFLCD